MTFVKEQPRFTDATITSLSDLEKHLEGDRRRGYSMSFGEGIPGVAAVSIPVVDSTGKVVASVSVLGPRARLSPAVLRRYARILREEIPVIPNSVLSAAPRDPPDMSAEQFSRQ